MIPDSFLLELKYRADIEQLIGGYVQLKRRGRNLTGLCPFHSEKSPSFTVYPESQSFYCFGCGAGGDAITFVKKIENLEYLEAVRSLADRVGMQMPEGSADDSAGKRKMRILEMNREAARFFYQTLLSDVGKAARAYLVGRGLTKATVTRFGLGFAPESWDSLSSHLKNKGFTEEELTDGYLAVRRQNGGCYDAFRNRIIFPIIDLRGAVIAFGGRNLGDKGPKYLNSGDTPVFKKSRNLFALNFAKNARRKELILCEGYMDVVAVHQGGFPNAVATLGTALTGEQARLVAQYTQEVVLAYDSDEAGQLATRRATGILEEAGVRVRVLTLSGAKDPDEFIKKFGPDRFEMLLAGSASAADFELAKLMTRHDTATPEGKVSFLQDFVRLMADNPSPIQREVYLSKVCRELEVDKQAVAAQLASAIKRKNAAAKKKEATQLRPYTASAPGAKGDLQRQKYPRETLAGEGIIAFLMRHPDGWGWVQEQMGEAQLVPEGDREIFEAIMEKLIRGLPAEAATLGAVLSEERMGRLMEIITREVYEDIGKTQAEGCVKVLREHRNQRTAQEIGGMSDEELGNYIASNTAHKK